MTKYNPLIAIIIPTFDNDDVLLTTIESILDTVDLKQHKIIIVDQNHPDTYSDSKKIFYGTAASPFHTQENQKIEIVPLGYNCGAGYARNEGIKVAARQRIPFVLMCNDNIEFTESMKKVVDLRENLGRYNILGFNILGNKEGAANIELVKNSHFEITPISTEKCKTCYKKLVIFNCEFIPNFYLTRTSLYGRLRYDDSLMTFEKEDFFIRLKWSDYRIGFTKFCEGRLLKSKTSPVKTMNKINGWSRLKEKYKLKEDL